MFLRKTIHKTKNFFQNSLQNLKSFLFGGYQKLPKAHPLIPFSISSTNNQKMQHLDNFYREFSEHWDSNSNKVVQKKKKNIMSMNEARGYIASNGNFVNYEMQNAVKDTQEEIAREENNNLGSYLRSTSSSGRGYVFVEKMKELEMMDVNDVDHVLDIEEILHYYSRLTCPVYVDLVDTFFMDMYSEFILPQPSASINSSMRRLGSV
ncbi:hypothetical protein LguiB_023215 [Lonicera macranthoides]